MITTFTNRMCFAVLILVFLPGCQAMRTYRWVENNTLYSTNLPGVEVAVNPLLHEGTEDSASLLEEDSLNVSTLWIDKEQYQFWDTSGKRQLIIEISNLTDDRYYMQELRLDSNSDMIVHDVEEIGEWRFDTGIFVNAMPQQSFLTKIFGVTFGTKTRLLLLYLEAVDSSWDSQGSALDTEKKTILKEFSTRAGESFSISRYSGIKPPEQREKSKPSKQ